MLETRVILFTARRHIADDATRENVQTTIIYIGTSAAAPYVRVFMDFQGGAPTRINDRKLAARVDRNIITTSYTSGGDTENGVFNIFIL